MQLSIEIVENNQQSKNDYSVGEIQLSYKRTIPSDQLPKIERSHDFYKVFLQSWDTDTIQFTETFKVALVNTDHRVIGLVTISSGSTVACIAEPKLIFSAAIKLNAQGICLCHNHPSGGLQPSKEDINLTKKIKEGCTIFNMTLLDHIILTDTAYFSMADQGLL